MQDKTKIRELLEQFTSGEAGRAEKQQLFNFINEPENKAFVYRWIKKRWNEPDSEQLSTDMDLDQLLVQIHHKINPVPPDRIRRTGQRSKLIHLVKTSMRYAAVCLLACGIEWYILTRETQQENTASVSSVFSQIDVPYGSKSFVVLPDSTKVWLNAGAKLQYPTNFKGPEREVFLDGEAFFDVKKDKHQPFFVRMHGMTLKVHGTKFNVRAYKEDPDIETTLLEGSVEVIGLKEERNSHRNLFLKPGQKLVLYKEKKKEEEREAGQEEGDVPEDRLIDLRALEPIGISGARLINLTATEPEAAWRKDKLIFDKQRFDEVKLRLERWYGVTIEVKDPSVLDYRFTGTFDKETFEQAMYALREAAGFRYEMHKKHVVISKNK